MLINPCFCVSGDAFRVNDVLKDPKDVKDLKDMLKKNKFATTLVDKCIKIFLNKQFSENFRTYKNYFTISWYVFPLFEKTLTKKHQQQHFIL